MSKTNIIGQTLRTMANQLPSLVAHPAVSAQESRELVLDELRGRIEYNSECLIHKLALSDVPMEEVKAGLKALRNQKDDLQRYEEGVGSRSAKGGERMMAEALVSSIILSRAMNGIRLITMF